MRTISLLIGFSLESRYYFSRMAQLALACTIHGKRVCFPSLWIG